MRGLPWRKMCIRFACALFLATALTMWCQERSRSGRAVTILDSACFEVSKGRNTRLEVPLNDDGSPDTRHASVKGLVVTYNPNCGNSRTEIRRDN